MKSTTVLQRLVAVVGVAALLTACTPAATEAPTTAPQTGAAPTEVPTEAPLPGGTVNVRFRGPVGSLEFTEKQLNATAGVVVGALYDRLVALDPDTNEVIPYLATSWDATATSIKFNLRTDATCADGTPVTPTVVKNSLDAFIAASPAVATSFGSGPFTVTADDSAGTVTINSDTPNSEMLIGFSDYNTSIVCPAGLVDHTAQARTGFGSGPYTIDSVVENDTFTVKLRSDWAWGPNGRTAQSSGVPDTIVFKTIENDTTAANLLLTGGLDIADIAGPDVDRLLGESSLTHRTVANAIASPMLFNQQAGKTAEDPAVRLAIMTAIDPVDYAAAAFGGRADTTMGGFIHEGQRCYDASLNALVPSTHTTDAARQVLRDAGYTEGADGKFSKDGNPLELLVLGQQSQRGGPEYISETLSQAGFTTTLNVTDVSGFSTEVRNLNFDIVQFTIGSPTVRFGRFFPFLIGGTLVTEGGVNRGTVFDPQVDAAYDAYKAESDPAQQCADLKTLQTRILDQKFLYPTVFTTQEYFGKNFTPYTEAWQFTRTSQ